MGSSALRDLAAIQSVPFEDLAGSIVAVDAHNWLYRYLTTTVRWTSSDAYTLDDGTEVPNLIGIVRGLPKFFEHDLTPIFVFDGRVVDLKADEVASRRESKAVAAEALAEAREAGDEIEAARLEAQTQRLTPVIQETTRELFSLLDMPMVEAPAEGEAQASHMARSGDVDYVGSEDYDVLLFGAPLTLRQLTSSGDPELMDLEATLTDLEITRSQLVDIAILCGTDFNQGLSGYGPKTALTAVKEHGDLETVLEAEDATIPVASAVQELFLEPEVTDEYQLERTVRPNLEEAWAYLTEEWHIPSEEIDTGFERLEAATTQAGLDRWA